MTDTPFRAPIGEDVRSPRAPRLLTGRGTYTDDVSAARIAHVAYLRSPYAHARIVAIDRDTATSAPDVLLVASGVEISEDDQVCFVEEIHEGLLPLQIVHLMFAIS